MRPLVKGISHGTAGSGWQQDGPCTARWRVHRNAHRNRAARHFRRPEHGADQIPLFDLALLLAVVDLHPRHCRRRGRGLAWTWCHAPAQTPKGSPPSPTRVAIGPWPSERYGFTIVKTTVACEARTAAVVVRRTAGTNGLTRRVPSRGSGCD